MFQLLRGINTYLAIFFKLIKVYGALVYALSVLYCQSLVTGSSWDVEGWGLPITGMSDENH